MARPLLRHGNVVRGASVGSEGGEALLLSATAAQWKPAAGSVGSGVHGNVLSKELLRTEEPCAAWAYGGGDGGLWSGLQRHATALLAAGALRNACRSWANTTARVSWPGCGVGGSDGGAHGPLGPGEATCGGGNGAGSDAK